MQNLLRVVPVVGVLSRVEDFKPVLNSDEVDAIFDAPLAMFLEVCQFNFYLLGSIRNILHCNFW